MVTPEPRKQPKKKMDRPRLRIKKVSLGNFSFNDFLQKAARPAVYFAGTFLFSFAECFSVPSPFAASLVAIFAAQGESMLWPLVGALASVGMRLVWGISLDIWQYVGLLLLMICRRFLHHKSELVMAGAAAIVLIPRFAAAIWQGPPAAIMLAGAGVLMGGAATPALKQAIDVLNKGPHVLSTDDKLCCLLLGAALLCGAGHMAIAGINVGLFVGSFITICLSYVSGSGVGAVGGLLAGTALALGRLGGTHMVHLALAGLVSGLFCETKGRWRIGLVYMLAMALAGLLTATATWMNVMLAALASTLCFFVLDDRFLRRIKTLVISAQPTEKRIENMYATEMLRQWEQSIGEMADKLPSPPDTGVNNPAKKLMDSLCLNCQENCEEEAKAQILSMMDIVWGESEKGEEALKQAIAELRGCGCIRLHLLGDVVAKVHEEQQQQMARNAKAEYERDMIATHLTALAASARRLADASRGETLDDLKGAAAIERALKQAAFPARLLYARRVGGHLQAAVEAETLAFTRWQPHRLTNALHSIAGLNMEVTLFEKNRMNLEECPPMQVETGYATICCQETEDGLSNGDAVIATRFPMGKTMAALSDGMGHGEGAQQESQTTLELLKLCMAAGYTVEQALTAVNGMMLSATGGDRFATVDMVIVDLWTGVAQMEKLGACTSYIVRGQRIRAIEGAALPLGILEHVSPISRQLRLYPEDVIVIMSDGAADAFSPDQGAEQGILRNYYQDPQRMADALLRCALVAAGGIPQDDMTVLVLKVIQAEGSIQMEEKVV